MRKKMSGKALEANRTNALKSTGPKTVTGKRKVGLNALKHGLLAKEVVIREGDGKENINDFDDLLSILSSDLEPVGFLEKIMVEKIAICYWRLRRVIICEIGEIRKELDSCVLKESQRKITNFEFQKKIGVLSDNDSNLEYSFFGIKHLMSVLIEVREDVVATDGLSKWAFEQLVKNFGGKENGITFSCFSISELTKKQDTQSNEPLIQSSENQVSRKVKEALIRMLDEEYKRLEKRLTIFDEKEKFELDSHMARLVLPRKEVIEKILRYETAIERQLYRAINQLERLQRQRRGDHIPPPINIEVSSEN